MSEKVTLFVDETPASRRARQILEEAKIPFRSIFARGSNLPTAHYLGLSYSKLQEISFLSDSIINTRIKS